MSLMWQTTGWIMSSFSRPTESEVLSWPICSLSSSQHGSGNAASEESSKHPVDHWCATDPVLMASVTHSTELSQPKKGRDRARGSLQSHCWKFLNWKRKIRREESLQKAKTNLAWKSHRHSDAPQPPLISSTFSRRSKSSRSVNRSGQNVKAKIMGDWNKEWHLKYQARKCIQPRLKHWHTWPQKENIDKWLRYHLQMSLEARKIGTFFNLEKGWIRSNRGLVWLGIPEWWVV